MTQPFKRIEVFPMAVVGVSALLGLLPTLQELYAQKSWDDWSWSSDAIRPFIRMSTFLDGLAEDDECDALLSDEFIDYCCDLEESNGGELYVDLGS